MKQHITQKQLEELDEFDRVKINDQCLSIGQMIEFLDQYTDKSGYGDWVKFGIFKNKEWTIFRCEHDSVSRYLGNDHKELCDALWEMVKDVLENEKVAKKGKK